MFNIKTERRSNYGDKWRNYYYNNYKNNRRTIKLINNSNESKKPNNFFDSFELLITKMLTHTHNHPFVIHYNLYLLITKNK
ncbi:hypothetical protein DR090_01985 [Mycoplasma hyopneumoniae]|nr:hypothetical protein [Mesomycoplasma hyopneumoniae]MXR63950.1 hypothetical protein [Mesomycoplasma hyopneumoniae]